MSGATGASLTLTNVQPADAGAWYLGLLTVRPDRQDQQLGRTLLAAAGSVLALAGLGGVALRRRRKQAA